MQSPGGLKGEDDGGGFWGTGDPGGCHHHGLNAAGGGNLMREIKKGISPFWVEVSTEKVFWISINIHVLTC